MPPAGPAPAPEEPAGHELPALSGRAAARDFAGVRVPAVRFGKGALMTRAAQTGAGFDAEVPAGMTAAPGRFTGSEVPGPGGSSAAGLRAFYAGWRPELTA